MKESVIYIYQKINQIIIYIHFIIYNILIPISSVSNLCRLPILDRRHLHLDISRAFWHQKSFSLETKNIFKLI